MAGEIIIPTDPANLALEDAGRMVRQPELFAASPEDHKTLIDLGQEADALGFTDAPYFVGTHRGLSMPVSFEASEDNTVRYLDFKERLKFEGIFKCYSKVMIGKIVDDRSVRALCLAFDQVTLLPYFDGIPEDHLLHVPVLAIDDMDQTSSDRF